MNQRAFNLFTALVSFVLIMLTMLIVNSMTRTESITVSTINDISEQAQMQTAADLARADAMQVFNYGLRYRIESWLSSPDSWYLLRSGKTWNEIKKDYACVNFGGCIDAQGNEGGVQFAEITSKTMTGLLEYGQTFGKYAIELENNEQELFEAIKAITARSAQDEDFFEVVECNINSSKTSFDASDTASISACTGTFYVKLKMGDRATITDEIYEKLPKIVVRNLASGDYLKEVILPRYDMRIYVPLRIFKAIAQAKYYGDTQVFSNHDLLSQFRLGMCDAGKCAPRTSIINQAGEKLDKFPCPGTKNNVLNAENHKKRDFEVNYYSSSDKLIYDPDKQESSMTALKQILERYLCENATADIVDIDTTDGLETVVDPLTGSCNIYSAKVDVGSTESKTIGAQRPYEEPANYDSVAYCASPLAVEARLKFKETNEKYKVNKNNLNIYTIAVVDNFPALAPNTEYCYSNCKNNTLDACSSGDFECSKTRRA